jgi:putative transposase
MTHQNDCTLPMKFLEQLTERDLEGLPELFCVLVNKAMRVERQNNLRAKPYERTKERRCHAIWCKPKAVKIRMGETNFDVPQVREVCFHPSVLEKGLRSGRALMLALNEKYVQDISTRKMAAITE